MDFLEFVRARRGHFKYESGHHSNLWLDLETLCLHPPRLRPFAVELSARLAPYRVDAVCGPLVEGAFVALLVAEQLDCAFTYADRFADPLKETMFPIEYRLPEVLQREVRGKRVAIVNDVISAGSAVRGAYADLQELEAEVVAIGALLVLGTAVERFARDTGVALETLARHPNDVWVPTECPLCAAGAPLDV